MGQSADSHSKISQSSADLSAGTSWSLEAVKSHLHWVFLIGFKPGQSHARVAMPLPQSKSAPNWFRQCQISRSSILVFKLRFYLYITVQNFVTLLYVVLLHARTQSRFGIFGYRLVPVPCNSRVCFEASAFSLAVVWQWSWFSIFNMLRWRWLSLYHLEWKGNKKDFL